MSFGYGLHFRDELEEPVAREFDALLSKLKAFFETAFNEDGSLKNTAIVAASSTPQAAQTEDHWWRHGAWTFDDPSSATSAHVIGLRPPKTPTGTYHNFAPGGIDDSVILEVEPDGGDVTFTGIKHNGGRKRIVLLRNRDSGNNLILADQNTGSNDLNRFDLPNNEDLVMGPGNSTWLYYDPGRDGGRWTAAITKNVSGGLASTNPDVLSTTVEISEAEIEALATTPKVLVAAPGSGFAINPIFLTIEITQTAAYASGGVWSLRYNGQTTDLITTFTDDLNNDRDKLALRLMVAVSLYSDTTTDRSNKAIQITSTANPTGAGSATARATLVYTITTSLL